MSEHSDILRHSVDRLFADFDRTADPAATWCAIEEHGIPSLMLPESDGGMEGSWRDAELVWRLLGRHAIALPVGETMIARHFIRRAALFFPDRPVLIGTGDGGVGTDGTFTGTALSLSPHIDDAVLLIGVALDNGVKPILIDTTDAVADHAVHNAAGEARHNFEFAHAPCESLDAVDFETVFRAVALLRASQIGGALFSCLDLCRQYTSERTQFGRELRRFQAIQHQIAVMAEEAAATAMAAAAAAAAMVVGEAGLEVSCAKLRANQACGSVALIAHQVHGAIGITAEYALQRFTRRLWAWRSEFGNDRFWAERIGDIVMDMDAPSPWHLISASSRT